MHMLATMWKASNPGDRSLQNSLIFFVYKRYLDPDNEDPEWTELFVQQSPPFSITPVYNSESSMFEVVLDDKVGLKNRT